MAGRKKFSGYMIFVNEWQAKNGRRNVQDAVNEASPAWEALPLEEKERYKEEARARNGGNRPRLDMKPPVVDNAPPVGGPVRVPPIVGGPPSLLVAACATRSSFQEKFYDDESCIKVVEDLCTNSTIKELVEMDFYISAFNVSVVTKEGEYIPIEMGFVKFSLKDGVKGFIHQFVDGGRIPVGLGYAVKGHLNSHKIELVDISEYPVSESAMTHSKEEHLESVRTTIAMINDFVKPKLVTLYCSIETVKRVKPIFSFPEHDRQGLRQTSGCLRRLSTEGKDSQFFEDYEVFDLSHLLFCLYRRFAAVSKPLAECLKDLQIFTYSGSTYTYCDYHQTRESEYCASARAYRFAFVVLDVLLPLTTLPITKYHLPLGLEEKNNEETVEVECRDVPKRLEPKQTREERAGHSFW